ncbi:MAG: translation initiation factor IF-2, partial [Planctomycetia bacterium]
PILTFEQIMQQKEAATAAAQGTPVMARGKLGDRMPGSGGGPMPGSTTEEDRKKGVDKDRNKRRGSPQRGRRFDSEGEDDDGSRRRGRRPILQRRNLKAEKADGPLVVSAPITVRSFSEATGVRANEVQRKLMALNIMATINSGITEEQAELLAIELGLTIEIKRGQNHETWLETEFTPTVAGHENLILRAPIVTFMGHVDHGKTSLMDRIRKANVVASESGGITQHIGAYQVKVPTHPIGAVTFLDTPGHEAFTAMRARGANATDIVVLVVAADDGVMPQTQEAINHAKAAEVPIIVAMNKMDLPGANPERLQQQLSQYGILSEAWGGDVPMVGTSAITGKGIDDLLETILLVAEIEELKADASRPGSGLCIEASMSGDRGVACTLLVQQGTMRPGDVVLCGQAIGRVRAMFDENDGPVLEAGPSTPVVVFGLDDVPNAGDLFFVVDDIIRARGIAEQRRSKLRADQMAAPAPQITLDSLF